MRRNGQSKPRPPKSPVPEMFAMRFPSRATRKPTAKRSSERYQHKRRNHTMSGKNTSVFGIYPDRMSVENAVDALKVEGFRNTDISVLLPDNVGSKDFAHQKNTKAPEGAATGAGSGAVVGGALGWLAGIGALSIPGLGPFIAAGPIMGMLAGVGAGGAVGGLAGGLIGLGIPEYEAKRYEGRIKEGC